MEGRYRAWQMEALALLYQVRTRNTQNGRITPSTYGGNKEVSPLVTHVCRGTLTKTQAGRSIDMSMRRRGMTIAERARESMFSRLMDTLSQIIAIEEGMYTDESKDGNILSVFPKDSVDLKNICLRLAENDSRNSPSDRDLRDLQGCLKCIAENLLSVCNENDASGLFLSRKLKDIFDTFPEMW